MRMRSFSLILVAVAGSVLTLAQTPADSHTVAVTIDDLPFVGTQATPADKPGQVREATAANRKLLAGLKRHHIPVTGFVIQKGVEELGAGAGTAILRQWIDGGFDLGNHTYAHPDFNELTIAEGEDQMVRGEAGFLPLMQAAGRTQKFLRFPMNHTGDTKEKHDAWAAFLAERGYRTAPCTIETEDWMFADAYGRMQVRHDKASMARLRADYLALTAARIDYFHKLNRQVLGYEPPHIMLFHDNQLNADVVEEILRLFEERKYRFVSLSEAESDPVYRAPETMITSYGPMWAYRWARERGVMVDGCLEPEAPAWIAEYMKKTGEAPKQRWPRSQF